MNIVIPMAGHSRRFRQAGYTDSKPFIDIDGRPMIAHVVDMFDPGDRFFFVLNSDQVKERPDAVATLKSLVRNSEVVVIPPHEKGPTYSALQVTGIGPTDDAIITYCDFTVDWNYRRFLQAARGHAGAIATFQGFHPASFGDTYYAYLRTAGEQVLEIREKKSFTLNRVEEPASAGLYYFGAWDSFVRHGQGLLDRIAGTGAEGYTSLVYTDLIAETHDVVAFEVERFLCWGTPSDLEQYLFWQSYFQTPPTAVETQPTSGAINLLPLAGAGRRFKSADYRVSKPLIQVHGKPMVLNAVVTMPPASRWIFVALGAELQRYPIQAALRGAYPDCDIVPVTAPTSGEAATCLLARETLPPLAELFISSCDHQTVFDSQAWQDVLADGAIDGAVWTYRMGSAAIENVSSFDFCQVADDGRTVRQVEERRAVSSAPRQDPMAIGSFWFRRAEDFVRAAALVTGRDVAASGEHSMPSVVNELIQGGKRFVIFDVQKWIPFGDPFQLKVFEYWQDHFFEKTRKVASGDF